MGSGSSCIIEFLGETLGTDQLWVVYAESAIKMIILSSVNSVAKAEVSQFYGFFYFSRNAEDVLLTTPTVMKFHNFSR